MSHWLKHTTALLLMLIAQTSWATTEVEILHWWTSAGEVRAVNELKKAMANVGYQWVDSSVRGGGGETAMTVLKSRVLAANPPLAAQIKGKEIQEWAKLGFLSDLSSVSQEQNWSALLPPFVAKIMQHKGKFVAVPFNIHKVNWIWLNKDVFRKYNLPIPTSWVMLNEVATKLQAKGVTPIALSNQAWQQAIIFEIVALGIGGSEFYHKAFVENDIDTLESQKMIKVLKQFKRLSVYYDDEAQGRDWDAASEMVIEGRAAMQIMGDWAKGEFLAAGKVAGVDFTCIPAPGTEDSFIYNIDSFVMFDVQDSEKQKAQSALAKIIMTPDFQKAFNLRKGSIPVRNDVPLDQFDECAQLSHQSLEAAAKTGNLLPSYTQYMATTSDTGGAIYEVITAFFRDPSMTPETAAHRLVAVVKAAMGN
ncbi:ABC transporter substrate-binding protein [Zooshikella sp. RANM57]|uniref:ABC transporter substrate-binding protein n=1 Tax=Zooshikella sp. RANM57 TaxID=3425863 RepID=UPI003D6DD35D